VSVEITGEVMKTLADLKRKLQKGITVKLTWSLYSGHKYLDKPRKVEIVQANAIMFEGGSWLQWGKASDYRFTPENPDRFTVLENGSALLSYKII
jgi:hypothetical protein